MTIPTTRFDPVAIAHLLARGLVDSVRAGESGQIVRQDADMPPSMRVALYRLSGLALEHGGSDLGASVHVVHGLAGRPLREWGIGAFGAGFQYADVVLLDPDLGQPTDDCLLLAAERDEEDLQESLIAHRIRTAINRLPPKHRDQAYRDVRVFTVRNPCVTTDALSDLFTKHSELYVEIAELYAPLPHTALHGRRLRLCAGCRTPLWPHANRSSYPNGYCRLPHCRLRRISMSVGDEIVVSDPHRYRLAVNPVLSFWTGPGLFEIDLYDRLTETRSDIAIYPFEDAADVGIDGTTVGIDVKSYSSAVTLGRRFARPLKRFAMFKQRIVAVPDERLQQDPDYLDTAVSLADRAHKLRFMTVSQVAREFSQ
jgi:hypothetical protein